MSGVVPEVSVGTQLTRRGVAMLFLKRQEEPTVSPVTVKQLWFMSTLTPSHLPHELYLPDTKRSE